MSFCHHALRFARLHNAAHQSEMPFDKYYTELNSSGSAGDMVAVTCGLKPPFLFDVWRSGDFIFLSSVWQDKTVNTFPIRTLTIQQRQTWLLSLIKADVSFLHSETFTGLQIDFLFIWHHLVEVTKNYKVSSMVLFSDCWGPSPKGARTLLSLFSF